MFVRDIAITNFKSFNERQHLLFEPGFNIILGGNNAGKSTVLEVLDLNQLNEPHRSTTTVPNFGDTPRGESLLEVGLTTSTLELGRLFKEQNFRLPLVAGIQDSALATLQHEFSSNPTLEIDIRQAQTNKIANIRSPSSFRGQMQTSSSEATFSVNVSPGGIGEFILSSLARSGLNHQVENFLLRARERIYRFGAGRRPASQCSMSDSAILDPDALFLPYCINHLQTSNAHGHRLLCEWVHRILPSVKWVQSTPMYNGQLVLHCLPTDPQSQRHDLATPIARMGTGIGNIIAILYVMLTSRDPQVIAIDEPNAFLHPRALRELLAITEAEGKRHQYILTAHSADVLTSINATTVNFVELNDSATLVTRVSKQELHTVRGKLADLGINVTDLHGKDAVLWVEGQSEELIFPEILKFACPEIAAGTAVLRVERTGTFTKKGVAPNEIAAIYERLSQSSGLVPPMICILLDAEQRKPDECMRLEEESSGRLRFLERAMLENYLLDSSAIHATLEGLGCVCNRADIALRLSDATKTNVERADGAKIIADVFSSASLNTQEFRKTRDVPTLFRWLIENRPSHLNPLTDFLRLLVKLPPRENTSALKSDSAAY